VNKVVLTGEYRKSALPVAIERCEAAIALRLVAAGG